MSAQKLVSRLDAAFDAIEAPHKASLKAIGDSIGYGRSCQILGELWDDRLEFDGYGRGRGRAERRRDIELQEVAKLAWRALCDAEAVLNTLDGDDVLESMNLDELRERVKACAGNLFSVLGLPVSALGEKP